MLHGWAGTSFPCVQSMRTGKVNRKRPAHTLNRRRSSRAANGGGGEEGLALASLGSRSPCTRIGPLNAFSLPSTTPKTCHQPLDSISGADGSEYSSRSEERRV